jgi:WD40 repeat protein
MFKSVSKQLMRNKYLLTLVLLFILGCSAINSDIFSQSEFSEGTTPSPTRAIDAIATARATYTYNPTASVAYPMIEAIAWSHDGTQIAFAGGNRDQPCAHGPSLYAIQIMDVKTRLTHKLERHSCNVTDLAWSPDDTQLASTSEDTVSYVSNVVYPENFIQSKAFSGSLMPMFGRKGIQWNTQGTLLADFLPTLDAVYIWDPVSGDTVATFGNKTGVINTDVAAIAWNPNGRQLAVASASGEVHIIDALTGEMTTTFDITNEREITSLAWSPDGHNLAVGGVRALIIDAVTGELIRDLQVPTYAYLVDWASDSRRLATIDNKTVHIWDTETGSELETFNASAILHAIDWSPDGTQLAYGGRGSDQITIVDVATLTTATR